MKPLIDLGDVKLEPITEEVKMPKGYSLSGAEAVYDNATAKLANKEAMDKLVELADRVKAMRDWEEGMDSIDKLTWDVEQAYKALVDKCGQHRAAEIVQELVMRS